MVNGYIAVTDKDKVNHIQEEFKGSVIDPEIKFPKDLGAQHPFDFEALEKVWKKVGIVNGIVNKLKNAIVGDFSVTVEDENVQAYLDSFIDETNFPSVLREWVKEALLKGNGFIELDLNNNNLRVLNANNMYVKRTKKGKIKEYNQWLGRSFKNMSRESNLLTTFSPNQIAHLKLNKMSNEAYGNGIIYPNERVISNIVRGEEDLHCLMKRKAGAPIHVQVGVEGENVNTQDIDDFSSKLQFMNNKTEWVTDANTKMSVLDFKGVTNNLTSTLDYDLQILSTSINIPVVLLGKANVPEGLAKVQDEDYMRFIKSIREEIESIVEEKIFKPLLLVNKFPGVEAQGLNKNSIGTEMKIDFSWNLPGEDDINQRIEKLSALMGNFGISENMKRRIQLELAKLLDFEDAEKYLLEPEVGVDQIDKQREDAFRDASLEKKIEKPTGPNSPEAKKEDKIKQPEVPGAKPSAKAKLHDLKVKNTAHMQGCGCGQQLTESQVKEMTIKEWVELKELDGFNYSDYLVRILKRLRTDKFETLSAITEQDFADGLLSTSQINKLRFILKQGFRKNRTMGEIQKEIDTNLSLKDRLQNGKIISAAGSRPLSIARTETVRLANLGLLDTYKENEIQQVRFLAALSERTCPQCEALNGNVFLINEASGLIPVHPMCRCTWVSVQG